MNADRELARSVTETLLKTPRPESIDAALLAVAGAALRQGIDGTYVAAMAGSFAAEETPGDRRRSFHRPRLFRPCRGLSRLYAT